MAATPQQTTSYFLDLPPELRSMIYTYLIVEDEPIETYRELVNKPEPGSLPPNSSSPSYTTSSLPSTYFLGHDYAVRPELPPIVSVSKFIRDEVLPLYFSANKFTIRVANGHLGSSPLPWTSVDEWRQHLGYYACHLRDVTVVTHNLHVSPGSLWTPWNDLLATRAMLREDGTMSFGLAAYGTYFCVCGLLSTAGEQPGGGKKDGQRVLKALDGWIEDAAYWYDEYSAKQCGECGLPQLTYATDERSEIVRGFVGGGVGGGAWT